MKQDFDNPSYLEFCVALLREILCKHRLPDENFWDKVMCATYLLNVTSQNTRFDKLYSLYNQVFDHPTNCLDLYFVGKLLSGIFDSYWKIFYIKSEQFFSSTAFYVDVCFNSMFITPLFAISDVCPIRRW